jgi:hypothetical protein
VLRPRNAIADAQRIFAMSAVQPNGSLARLERHKARRRARQWNEAPATRIGEVCLLMQILPTCATGSSHSNA